MRLRSRLVIWGLYLLPAVIVAFFVITMPVPDWFGNIGSYVPRLAALKGYPHGGCGLFTSNEVTHTTFYRTIVANDALRREIKKEATENGFKEQRGDDCIVYRKSTGGVFPIYSYVIVGNDGRVFAGARRSKWPQIFHGS